MNFEMKMRLRVRSVSRPQLQTSRGGEVTESLRLRCVPWCCAGHDREGSLKQPCAQVRAPCILTSYLARSTGEATFWKQA
mmetsp:Transcript_11075/g.18035  ORF Transcript_11075/g.18035 Transcript_11075/m.18035 type:complete len:80 (-) Transcript_11075:199-438(-)